MMDNKFNWMIIFAASLFFAGCDSSANKPAPSRTDKKDESPAVETKELTAAELRQKAIESAFEEFQAAQKETDPTNWKVRYDKAFETMTAYGKEAIPVILKGLKSKDILVRQSASDLLSFIGPSSPESMSQFLEFLNDESEVVRVNLVSCLCLAPEHQEHAIQELKKLLKSRDQAVQSNAAGAAATLDAKAYQVADELLSIIEGDNNHAKNLAIEAIQRIEKFNQDQTKRIQSLIEKKAFDESVVETLRKNAGIK